MFNPVASISATVTEIARAVDAEKASKEAIQGSMRLPIAGSAIAPRANDVTVIPSWAPDNSNERFLSEPRIRRADRSPSAARRSTLLRSTATIENSPATKNPVRRTSTTAEASPR